MLFLGCEARAYRVDLRRSHVLGVSVLLCVPRRVAKMTSSQCAFRHMMGTKHGGALSTKHGGYYMSEMHAKVPDAPTAYQVQNELLAHTHPVTDAQNDNIAFAQTMSGTKRKAAWMGIPWPGQAMVNDSSNPFKMPRKF